MTNAVLAYYYGYEVYALLFLFLFITSVIYHSTRHIYANIIDKISILSIVLYGAYLFYIKTKSIYYASAVIVTVLLTLFLYVYGYFHNSYCFHHDKSKANTYHSLMHTICSLGHHLIIIM